MPTKLLYFSDAYQTTATAHVQSIEATTGQTAVVLDQTIFYSQGGGQPADQGSIIGPNGTLNVSHVSYSSGYIQHKGQLEGELAVGDQVELSIDWPRRYQHMQWHTAGHILDQAVKNLIPGIKGVEGNHGIGKKKFVEFDQEVPETQQQAIENEITKIIAQDLPIATQMKTYEELVTTRIQLPPDLPTNKPLRIVQIGQYPPMPDGGTQLKSTAETWPVTVTQIIKKGDVYRVVYEVTEPTKNAAPTQTNLKSDMPKNSDSTISFAEYQKQLVAIDEYFASQLSKGKEALRVELFGKSGAFNSLPAISQMSPEDRRQAGPLLNTSKQKYLELIEAMDSTKTTSWIDLTEPGKKPSVGHIHPITQAIEEITGIFERIGFTRVRYPEVDWDWYVFESLNMPPDHPARDEWETFFVDAPDNDKKGKMVLTTHTSNGQVREMERLKSQPPIRMVNIARCYRRQQDATHTQMFHQFEGLVVDKGITIQHLKGTLDYFAQEFYGPGTKSRIRPFHFRFTEPSFEVDFSCHICGGTGEVKTNKGEKTKCKFCKSGWHEVGGAGMVHPNVLKAGGIDPEQYTGFAFGWGVERTYTLKEALNIDDIRLIYSGDLRFLEQF